MLLGWFDARRATEAGITLADQYASVPRQPPRGRKKTMQQPPEDRLRELLRTAERIIQPLRLNFYKKAKLANSFKWRLLEKGVESQKAAEVTQTLVMHLSLNRAAALPGQSSPDAATSSDRPLAAKPKDLLAQANADLAAGRYEEATHPLRALIKLAPRNAGALNNLGVALCHLGQFREAEPYLRSAIDIQPNNAETHVNLALVLRARGQMIAAENSLRKAVKLRPDSVTARVSLGSVLLSHARPSEARVQFEKALKLVPNQSDALLGMGQVAQFEGRFEEAEALFKQALALNPRSAAAVSGLMGLRKMTRSDAAWLKSAEEILAGGVGPIEETNLRFAIGKYCDDVGDFEPAFRSYQRGNEILKANAEDYDHEGHERFVNDLMRVYTREMIAQIGPGASPSSKPVLVVGMPRSGTSLIEQIVASHPAVRGAGELNFWTAAMKQHEAAARQRPLDEPLRQKLANSYLQALTSHGGDALRVVDKAPVNSDFLGMIHSVFPQARIIYVQRNPIDTCLSCYFQQFSSALRFTMDLTDLAHYYRQHHRLMQHWRAVLPPGALLDVPYEQLVAHQEEWTRKILEFLGLEWDERCLNFHNTNRTVATASAWQVRQKIYRGSIERWRNYEKFIGPLKD